MLDWEPPINDGGAPIQAYRVYRDGTLLHTTDGAVTELVDPDLVNGVPHSYAVDAVTRVAVSTATPTVTATATAVAPPPIQPDLAVGRADRIIHGQDIYNATGFGQARRARAAPGVTTAFHVRMQNDGPDAGDFTLDATVPAGVTARFLAGRADVTAEVSAGTYRITALAPNAVRALRVEVTARRRLGTRVEHPILVTARSLRSPALVDVVRVIRTTP